MSLTLLTNPEKLTYLCYFFPVISSGYVDWIYGTPWTKVVLIVSVFSVMGMISYHLAYNNISTKKQDQKLLKEVGNLSLDLDKNLLIIRPMIPMAILMLAWFGMYIFTLRNLFYLWSFDKSAPYLIIAQISLFLMAILTMFIMSNIVKSKQKQSEVKEEG